MRKSSELFLLLMCCLLLFPLAVQAQIGESSLTGLGSNPTGTVIAQTQIALRGVDGSIIRSATSREDGTYLIPALLPGRYTLTISAAGFETQRTEFFDLTLGQTATINFNLKDWVDGIGGDFPAVNLVHSLFHKAVEIGLSQQGNQGLINLWSDWQSSSQPDDRLPHTTRDDSPPKLKFQET